MLNLVPFGALADARGQFLIQHFAISYVSAGRDLAGSFHRPGGNAGSHRGEPWSESEIRRRGRPAGHSAPSAWSDWTMRSWKRAK